MLQALQLIPELNSSVLGILFVIHIYPKDKRTNYENLLQAAQIQKTWRSEDTALQTLKLSNEPCNQVKLKTS